jgi:hypothetical protein
VVAHLAIGTPLHVSGSVALVEKAQNPPMTKRARNKNAHDNASVCCWLKRNVSFSAER